MLTIARNPAHVLFNATDSRDLSPNEGLATDGWPHLTGKPWMPQRGQQGVLRHRAEVLLTSHGWLLLMPKLDQTGELRRGMWYRSHLYHSAAGSSPKPTVCHSFILCAWLSGGVHATGRSMWTRRQRSEICFLLHHQGPRDLAHHIVRLDCKRLYPFFIFFNF